MTLFCEENQDQSMLFVSSCDESDALRVVVIDFGADFLRVGFADEQSPRFNDSSVLGIPREQSEGLTYTQTHIRSPCALGRAAYSPQYTHTTPLYPAHPFSSCATPCSSPVPQKEFLFQTPAKTSRPNSFKPASDLDRLLDAAVFERVILKIFRDVLRIEPGLCKILITQQPTFPAKFHENIAEILLNNVCVSACALVDPLALAAMHFARTHKLPVYSSSLADALSRNHALPAFLTPTVCVLDCGGRWTRCAVVCEGRTQRENLVSSLVAGRALDDFLARTHPLAVHTPQRSHIPHAMLTHTPRASHTPHTPFTPPPPLEVAEPHYFSLTQASAHNLHTEAKEALCEISLDFTQTLLHGERERYPHSASLHRFSDGSTLDIEFDKFVAAEGLFCPSRIGVQDLSVTDCVVTALSLVHDRALRKYLLSHIVVVGGTTKMRNFSERLAIAVRERLAELDVDADTPVCVRVVSDPQLAAWQGGALLARTTTVLEALTQSLTYTRSHADTQTHTLSPLQWITQNDWAKSGGEVVRLKCWN